MEGTAKNESLTSYVKRLLVDVVHENPILVGVSFGGIIIQEMSKFIQVRKLVVVSSVLSEKEFPKRMVLAQKLKLYRLFPTALFSNFDALQYFMVSKNLRKRLELYKTYLFMNDKKYLDWAIATILNWKTDLHLNNTQVIRIHGENDEVFPLKYINTNHCYVIPKATHAMIVYKYKWFNKNLPLILNPTKL
ncbi:alpha/beta hydrolase [Flavobacterium agricola]|uniref:alpha/beta hydrolase n=1 Tax=Flavobacterium agricola TaxID=2870839 RepID=UPI002939450B|nr:alpha/beta hydrolase [Flavobacterium agricola]